MRVYLDTNVYRHISEASGTSVAKQLIKKLGWRVVASAENLFETYAIRDRRKAADSLIAITQVAAELQAEPSSYWESREVVRAMGRYQPSWVRRVVFDRFTRRCIAHHRASWERARHGHLPDSVAYAAYRRDFETGTADSIAVMKALRQQKIHGGAIQFVAECEAHLGLVDADLQDPSVFWRWECYCAYESALVQRRPEARDLYDWVAPHLKVDQLTRKELFLLWLRDFQAIDVPAAAWSGTVAWGQLHSKVSHGNTNDQLHAAMALVCDAFITADRGFFSALDAARQHYDVRPLADFVLWPRESSVSEAIGATADTLRARRRRA